MGFLRSYTSCWVCWECKTLPTLLGLCHRTTVAVRSLEGWGAACFRTTRKIAFCSCKFPKLRVLSCDATHHMAGIHIGFLHHPLETWGLGDGENILMFTLSAVLQESFVSDLSLRLLWVTTKWQLLSRTKPDPRTGHRQREREERIEPSSSDFCFSLYPFEWYCSEYNYEKAESFLYLRVMK